MALHKKEEGHREETAPFNYSSEQQSNEVERTLLSPQCQDNTAYITKLYRAFKHDISISGKATSDEIAQSKELLLERERGFYPKPEAKLETPNATYYRYLLTSALTSYDRERWNDYNNRPRIRCEVYKTDEYLTYEIPEVDGDWISLGGEPQPLEAFLPDTNNDKSFSDNAEQSQHQGFQFTSIPPATLDDRPASKDVREAAARYIEDGFSVVAVQPGGKAVSKKGVPNNKSWSDFAYKPSHFALNSNVSIRLGRCHGCVVDIDCDSSSTWRAAKLVFPEGARYGRRSGKTGHILIRCPDIPADDSKLDYTFKKKAAEDLVEIANGRIVKGGILEARASAGMHSVVPPSIYIEGEDKVEDLIEWIDGPPKGVEGLPSLLWEEIEKRCQLLTLLAVADALYPESGRNNFCFALAGVLARLGLDPRMIDHITIGLAQINNDEEAEKRRMGERTVAALESGEHIKGLPAFAEEAGLSDAIVKDLRKWLGLEGVADNCKAPENALIIREGELPRIVDESVDALCVDELTYFIRGGELCKTSKIQSDPRISTHGDRHKDLVQSFDGIKRAPGSVVLRSPKPSTIRLDLMRRVSYGRVDSKGIFNPKTPEQGIFETIKSSATDLKFPVLKAITKSPTLDRNGKVLATAGYDPKTQIYGDFDPDEFPSVSNNPSDSEVATARETLRAVISEYKFETKNICGDTNNFGSPSQNAFSTAKSVMLAAMLTSVCRAALPTAPGFIFDAVVAGSGKSKLASICGVMATGSKPAVTTQGKTEEEDEKRLGATLMAGDPVILFDNITRPIDGDLLCSLMVEESVSIRPLGRSEIIKLPVASLITFTGNNVSVRGDMSRRLLVCRVNPGVENPEKSVFPFDPVKKALEMRAELVWAALTIMRAYAAHLESRGERVKVKEAMGSFEEWSLMVREALIFAGCADPVDTREAIVAGDTEKDEFVQLLDLWEQSIGSSERTATELRGLPDEWDENHPARNIADDLVDHLVTMTGRTKFNSRSIGRLLSKYRDRIVDGRKLTSSQVGKHAAKWQLVSTDGIPISEPEKRHDPF